MSIRPQEQVTLLTDYDSGSAYSKAYHTLLANIRFNWGSEQSKRHTLLLTTAAMYALPLQATVAANVAIASAQNGIPTILVDADLHKPGFEQRFGLARSKGLSELLAEEPIPAQDIDTYLQQTFVPGLRLLGAGTITDEAPLRLATKLPVVLASIQNSLIQAESGESLIIFNSPPVLAGPDASLIGTLVDQTIVIIIKGRTTHSQAKQAQEQLQRAHANLAGIVLLDR